MSPSATTIPASTLGIATNGIQAGPLCRTSSKQSSNIAASTEMRSRLMAITGHQRAATVLGITERSELFNGPVLNEETQCFLIGSGKFIARKERGIAKRSAIHHFARAFVMAGEANAQ